MATRQVEEYLLAIASLERKGVAVTTSALAKERRVSPPSVTEMLHRLSEQHLVSYEPRGKIALTEAGREVARTLVRRHRLWERFLHEVLHIRWDRVHREACKLEHATSPEVEEQLARVVGHNPASPHGYPISESDGQDEHVEAVPPSELSPPQ